MRYLLLLLLLSGCASAPQNGITIVWHKLESQAFFFEGKSDNGRKVNGYSRIVDGDRGPVGSGPTVAMGRLASSPDGGRATPSLGDHFGPTERATFRHSVRHTGPTLVMLMRSRSYFLTATARRQAELEAQVLDLAGHHPDLAGREDFELPYVTNVFRSIRR